MSTDKKALSKQFSEGRLNTLDSTSKLYFNN